MTRPLRIRPQVPLARQPFNAQAVLLHCFVVDPFAHDRCRVRGGNTVRGLPVGGVGAGGVEEAQQLVCRIGDHVSAAHAVETSLPSASSAMGSTRRCLGSARTANVTRSERIRTPGSIRKGLHRCPRSPYGPSIVDSSAHPGRRPCRSHYAHITRQHLSSRCALVLGLQRDLVLVHPHPRRRPRRTTLNPVAPTNKCHLRPAAPHPTNRGRPHQPAPEPPDLPGERESPRSASPFLHRVVKTRPSGVPLFWKPPRWKV